MNAFMRKVEAAFHFCRKCDGSNPPAVSPVIFYFPIKFSEIQAFCLHAGNAGFLCIRAPATSLCSFIGLFCCLTSLFTRHQLSGCGPSLSDTSKKREQDFTFM